MKADFPVRCGRWLCVCVCVSFYSLSLSSQHVSFKLDYETFRDDPGPNLEVWGSLSSGESNSHVKRGTYGLPASYLGALTGWNRNDFLGWCVPRFHTHTHTHTLFLSLSPSLSLSPPLPLSLPSWW